MTGSIVAAACMSHSPGITGFPERADPVAARHVMEGFGRLAATMASVGPDAIVMVSAEHFTNFFIDNLPPFAIGTASGYELPASAAFASFLKIPQRRYPGHEALGRTLHAGLIASEFDPALVAGGYGFDEGFAVPLALVVGDRPVPVVPVVVNTVYPPYPSLRRCYAFGSALAGVLAAQDVAERVMVLGTGGLSHWVGLPRAGEIDEVFDREVLDAFASGQVERILDMGDDEIDRSGNGAHEVRAWVMVAGAVSAALGGSPGRAAFSVLAYEPVPAWLTGTCVLEARLDLDGPRGPEEQRGIA
jgi:protocatechuate 4,5-dioxygenase beta chain/2,3-dihydroxyphenylpropionate 1,2-dioxygenase